MTNASTPKPALFRMRHLWQGGMVLLLFLSMEPKAMTQPSAADGGSVSVHFSKATLLTILPFYSGVTGKKVMLDSTLQGEPVQIIAPQPLTRAEAASFIEATLLLNG